MEFQDFTLERNTDTPIHCELQNHDGSDVSTWTTVFEVYINEDFSGTPVFTKAGAVAGDVPNAAHLGIFEVLVTSADSTVFVYGRTYNYRFRRTNTGYITNLSRGKMKVI